MEAATVVSEIFTIATTQKILRGRRCSTPSWWRFQEDLFVTNSQRVWESLFLSVQIWSSNLHLARMSICMKTSHVLLRPGCCARGLLPLLLAHEAVVQILRNIFQNVHYYMNVSVYLSVIHSACKSVSFAWALPFLFQAINACTY